MKKYCLLILCFMLFTQIPVISQTPPPAPLLPIPTARQLAWQQQELIMFVHFTVNTFTDREWGDGTEDPVIFNPVNLDAEQWVRTAGECGFKTVILTAKHHDGFCLWPGEYTNHSVKSSPWKDGQGDVVGELAAACKKYGVKMGIYLSPWDRHEQSYGQGDAYNNYYLAQLRELMSNYGQLAEMWFDGACGEGSNGKKQVYDFKAYRALVRQLQPRVVMFSDAGPDVRWIGNEHGFAGETNWSMMDKSRVVIGGADTGYLNNGDINGPDWVPGECDVSIRKGWFWHRDQQPKSVDELLDIYFKSVGRNGLLLLNVPPNDKGLFADEDVKRLYEFHEALDDIFKNNLALNKKAHSNHVRSNSDNFSATNVTDGDNNTYWAPDDSTLTGFLEIDLGEPVSFNVVEIREPIAMGQRIKAYDVVIWDNSGWKQVCNGTTVGYKKLDSINKVSASRIRVNIKDARACPLVSEIGLYANPFAQYEK